jgi:C-terminal processing protease CtpA/Prc
LDGEGFAIFTGVFSGKLNAVVNGRLLVVARVALLSLGAVGCAEQRGTIGARLGRDREGHVVVREVPEGLGAAEAGLKPGDEILLIGGQDVRELSPEQLHAVLSGERRSRVRITVQRGEKVIRVAVERTPPKPIHKSQ